MQDYIFSSKVGYFSRIHRCFFLLPFSLQRSLKRPKSLYRIPIHKAVGSSVGVVGSSPDGFKEIFHKLDSDKI